MADLVIVESPAKAKTIKKYLGKNFEVVASMGHIRDLPKSKLGVDLEDNFNPSYINIKGKESLIKELKAAAKKSDKVYLATDPDREGEAISWHLATLLNLDVNSENRVTFNEITKTGVKAGMSNPCKINLDLFYAQQARRILDRIVGYKLSPFLWKKVRRGLSAGRVQSVTVKIICDRENEIRSFVSTEYWSVDAKFLANSSKRPFAGKLTKIDGKKFDILTGEETQVVLAELEDAEYLVSEIKKGVSKKSPAPPFTTSTMQQEASKKLGFQARRTMRAAQDLYEGIDIPDLGAVGLITYMRTDSLRISDDARSEAYKYITEKYGANYLPPEPRVYKSKKNAQDAHEAVRPTMVELTPEKIKESLTTDQYKLYKLIWKRFIASQMANALHDTISATITAKKYEFKSSGYTVKFDGFTALYEEVNEEQTEVKNVLPRLEKGDVLTINDLQGNQHFTQPPPRYTEASLIKALEENGIGRPSTYAPTISTITARNYVERQGKQLIPTSLGEVTTTLMEEHFKQVVDVKFTAGMEDDLDKVEEGDKSWTGVLSDFYNDFDNTLTVAEEAMDGKRVKVPDEETDIVCDLCGKNMVIKIGRFGKFLACPGFPECKNTKNIVSETGGNCPFCGKKVLEKKSQKGRKYYGCEDNPKCTFMTWDLPTKEVCPSCGSTLFQKGGKNGKLICHKKDCGYEKDLSRGSSDNSEES